MVLKLCGEISVQLPDELLDLEANCGIYAIWMIFHHYGVDLHIPDLVKLCKHNDQDGTFGIALAVALQKLGLDVTFYSDEDLAQHSTEVEFYQEAQVLGISVQQPSCSYQDIQYAVENGNFVIVYYDTLEGVGNHSLVYSIDDVEISFFDSFEPMPKTVFEQQRQVEGICRQVIIVDDRKFCMRDA